MYFRLVITILFSWNCLFSQTNFKGNWQGVLFVDGKSQEDAEIFYLSIEEQHSDFQGKTREEIYKTEFYAVQRIKGKIDGKTISFQQTVTESKKSSSKITWCTLDAKLSYNDSTGYLSGDFTSTSCRRHTGKLILYRTQEIVETAGSKFIAHGWRDIFLDDLKNKRNAPEIRAIERKNFVFTPIYFDTDQSEIKPEFHTFLNKMIRVVNGHSDLRIKITGHTDAVGSDAYNDALSKRRATAIRAYFVAHGLAADRLVIDFKGEKLPVDNNETPEGKQRNRRVDFEFI